MITFMTYYVELSERAIRGIREAAKVACKGAFQPTHHADEMIKALFESARRHHPEGRFVLVTDEKTKVALPDYVEVCRKPEQSPYIELENYLSLMHFPQFYAPESHLVILDPDIIVLDRLDSLFETDAALYFTYQRDSEKEAILKPSQKKLLFPINTGVVAVHKERKLEAGKLLLKLINFCREQLPEKYRYWFGLQMTLSNLFREKLLSLEASGASFPYLFGIEGVKVCFIDAGIYNYPCSNYCYIPLNAKIAHFKGGKAKKQMLAYWEELKRLKG